MRHGVGLGTPLAPPCTPFHPLSLKTPNTLTPLHPYTLTPRRQATARAKAYAPHADLIWMETAMPEVEQASSYCSQYVRK